MTEPGAGDKARDLSALRAQALECKRKADAAMRAYDRTAWITYVAIWVPIPFAVLIARLHLEAWHYYVVGALFVAAAAVLYAVDMAAVARRDQAIREAERAQEVYDEAVQASRFGVA